MCAKNVVRRFSAFLSALVLCFSLTIPAFADDVSTNSFSFSFASPDDFIDLSVTSGSVSKSVLFPSSNSGVSFSFVMLNDLDPSLQNYSGSVGVYLSFFYFSQSVGARQNKVPSSSDFDFYTYELGGSQRRGVVSSSLFSPSSSYVSMSDGVSLVGRISGSVGDPLRLSSLNLSNGGWSRSWSDRTFTFTPITGSFPANDAGVYITSFRVVTSGSSQELDAIEDMASNIAAQNQILSQFYGDIVAVCNQIYQRLGDLQAAQEEANALFSNVISLLNSTNGKLDAINQAMSTYFELVLKSLSNESLAIQQAIADAELRLETYLKPVIDYFNELEETTGESAATLPQHKTDLDGFASDSIGIDGDAQTGLAAILPILTAFSFIFQILGIFIGLGILGIIVRKGLS